MRMVPADADNEWWDTEAIKLMFISREAFDMYANSRPEDGFTGDRGLLVLKLDCPSKMLHIHGNAMIDAIRRIYVKQFIAAHGSMHNETL